MVFARLYVRHRARHRQMAARAHQRQGARRAAGDRTIEAGVKATMHRARSVGKAHGEEQGCWRRALRAFAHAVRPRRSIAWAKSRAFQLAMSLAARGDFAHPTTTAYDQAKCT